MLDGEPGGDRGCDDERRESALRAARAPVATATASCTSSRRFAGCSTSTPTPRSIDAHLARDPTFRPLVRRAPRAAGSRRVDPVEIGVRAILGQQVSVAAATTLAGRLVERVRHPGRRARGARPHRTSSRPRPALATAPLDDIGITQRARRRDPGVCAAAIVPLDGSLDLDELVRRLRGLPGIGEWTAQYIAMRAAGERDAFPAADLGLRHALGAIPAPRCAPPPAAAGPGGPMPRCTSGARRRRCRCAAPGTIASDRVICVCPGRSAFFGLRTAAGSGIVEDRLCPGTRPRSPSHRLRRPASSRFPASLTLAGTQSPGTPFRGTCPRRHRRFVQCCSSRVSPDRSPIDHPKPRTRRKPCPPRSSPAAKIVTTRTSSASTSRTSVVTTCSPRTTRSASPRPSRPGIEARTKLETDQEAHAHPAPSAAPHDPPGRRGAPPVRELEPAARRVDRQEVPVVRVCPCSTSCRRATSA